MPSQSDLRFTFQPLVGRSEFEVVSFELDEAISTPFQLKLELVSFEDDVDFGQLLDKPVLFTIWRGERPLRYVHGLVSTFSQGETGFHRTCYRALVEPVLARAGLRSNWRIFQQKTVPQILEIMLKRQGITGYELKSIDKHEVREFCVQAGETDLDFIARLAAEEGFVYRFEHTPKLHRLLITDRLLGLGQISQGAIKGDEEDEGFFEQDDIDPNQVLYHANSGGDQARPCLRHLRYSEQVRTARQVQRDYTFTHPAYRQEQRADGSDLKHQSTTYERFDYPGRYKRGAVGAPFTATRITALRHDARLAEVEGDDVRLQPGLSFTLTEHPRKDLNMHWRVNRVHHEGSQFTSLQEEAAGAQQGTRYTQAAVLVPGRTEWRPAPLPKPRIDGPQMATVVGPKGEEIYCDQWGRVKVSFPWDRESQDNEFSSCWVRVSQGWAGGSWGSMAIPRIGQDVIIQYVDADPDQPMITGRTYCGNQLPPYDLPKHKTRMTIKSQTHKGKGFNELRFEDELGKEEVFIHAQRDQNNIVGNDETTRVGRNRVEQVGQDEQLTIGNNFRQETARDHIQFIGQNSRVDIKQDLTEQVGNNRSETTGANQRVVVGNNSELVIKGAQSISVGQGVQTRTTVYQLLASERIEFRSPGGSIVLDAQGITINGLTLDLQGQTKAVAKGDGNSQSLEFTADGSNKCEVKA
ncbi:TPA: type VI secretion system tip protein VgrG [Pseudomonas putida]|uniref:type VI secretion system Vgr family protein n=1 Tax=Pseudomonas TaxID=286 RepID=UPI00104A66A5|nr:MULTISPECIES: type VI secretion system tip protein TssI/VgrG [Pseudomonas]MCS4065257.1 type VI secretion system secreted protein VgrG [Pseudomonas putida]MDD1993030.1 type VI secretion system tip protein VgrG [Pseudomonas putida]TCP76638.1 type VI secretion system secreted protein VgrG [Pseudomonas putida]HDS0917830.1 type VI secretion system tip protein VgrG [Pseudomonas putida]HDS0936079.1 type VI secretion system tip protein VgrG [Pseudomonas putida]